MHLLNPARGADARSHADPQTSRSSSKAAPTPVSLSVVGLHLRDPLSDAIDNLMASAGAVLLVSLLSETRMRTVLILRLIRITTLVSGDARGRSLDDLWTTGCSRQHRTTARRARSAIFTSTYTDARTRLDRLTELLTTSTTSTTGASPPNDASSTASCSPTSPSTPKRTPPTPQSAYSHHPRAVNIDVPAKVMIETKLSRQDPGGTDL